MPDQMSTLQWDGSAEEAAGYRAGGCRHDEFGDLVRRSVGIFGGDGEEGAVRCGEGECVVRYHLQHVGGVTAGEQFRGDFTSGLEPGLPRS